MPGDSRLVGAIRQLTSQAADYAQLSAETREHFAGHVERAAAAAIAAASVRSAPIEFRFRGDEEALVVALSCDVQVTATPPSLNSGEVTVDWTLDGTRHVCRIRQRLSA
jgi:hypothetical protein